MSGNEQHYDLIIIGTDAGGGTPAYKLAPTGKEITSVETEIDGRSQQFQADIVIVACGAINSAALLLRSATDRHPTGLANRSDLVGRDRSIGLTRKLKITSLAATCHKIVTAFKVIPAEEIQNANRIYWTWADGREHGATIAASRTGVRGVQPLA